MSHARYHASIRAATVGLILLVAQGICAESPEQALIDWIVSLGGSVNAEFGINADGVRGLFANKDVKKGEAITVVPFEAIINTGGRDFETPTLIMLRELHDERGSRFQPYLDAIPPRHEILNSCNLPVEYISMLQNDFWEDLVRGWHASMQAVFEGQMYENGAMNLVEAIGPQWRNITIEDLQYACAVTTTRYVLVQPRTAPLMVPIFDHINHNRHCLNHFEIINEPNFRGVAYLSGHDVPEGEEFCSYYGDIRDDYTVVHYGFLPAVEDPPRLLLADHPANTATDYTQLDGLSGMVKEDPYPETPDEIRHEVQRVQGILSYLEELDQSPPPPRSVPGADHAYDLLVQLQQRRRYALHYRLNWLQEALGKQEL